MTDTSDSEVSFSRKTFKCTELDCLASFSKQSKLLVHLRKHTGERPFICDEPNCTKTYTNNSHLRRHKKTSHGEKSDQSVACDFDGCGAVLANKYSLKKHYNRVHNADNYAFKCQDCTQGFHRKKLLQQHIYLHTGEAIFNCDKCDLCFMTSYSLNKHKRSHKEHKCDCGEVFHRWSVMLAHRKLCRKPSFKCEVCNKTFNHLGNLRSHKLTHVDNSEKFVFICPYTNCERFYLYKKNLVFHINNFHKKHNENKKFKCSYPKCRVILKTKRLLKIHLQRHYQLSQKRRKIRRDKGVVKKNIVSVLIGDNLATKSNKENYPQVLEKSVVDSNKENNSQVVVTTNETVNDNNCQTVITEKCVDIEDDPLLKECDLTLSLLNEKIMSIN